MINKVHYVVNNAFIVMPFRMLKINISVNTSIQFDRMTSKFKQKFEKLGLVQATYAFCEHFFLYKFRVYNHTTGIIISAVMVRFFELSYFSLKFLGGDGKL